MTSCPHRLGAVAFACASALALAPSAHANQPPAAARSQPIRVPSMGGFSVGTATMNVTYTDAGGTATVGSPSVALGPNQVVRIDSCLRVRVVKEVHDTTCRQKVVDTTTNTATVKVPAPTATATFTRPAAGHAGYVAPIVSI